MHSARIPPVDPAPATIIAVLATHAGHICPCSELLSSTLSILQSFLSLASGPTQLSPRSPECKQRLAFQCLGYAGAPALRYRFRHGIREDILVTFFHSVEDGLRNGLCRSLGMSRPRVISVSTGPVSRNFRFGPLSRASYASSALDTTICHQSRPQRDRKGPTTRLAV